MGGLSVIGGAMTLTADEGKYLYDKAGGVFGIKQEEFDGALAACYATGASAACQPASA